jgi:hypothetical protein
MDDAQRMIGEVLQAHPASAKAHFVHAELLAKQGKTHEAAGELASAEKLAPGLPFAKAEAVTKLKAIINRPAVSSSDGSAGASLVPSAASSPGLSPGSSYQTAPAPRAAGFPWGTVVIGIVLLLFVVWAARALVRRAAPGGGYGPVYGPAYGPGGSPAPYGPAPGYGQQGYAPMGQAPGMGGQIMGGLATGAAVGVGMVAAEEIAHHMFGGNSASAQGVGDSNYVPFQSIPDNAPPADDMGGTDFGIADNSSWDDSGSSGGGDWN